MLCVVYFVPVQVFIFYILSCWLCVVMCCFFACVLVFLFACLFCFVLFVCLFACLLCFVYLFVLLDFFSLFLPFALLIISPTPLLTVYVNAIDHAYVLLCNLVYFLLKYKM